MTAVITGNLFYTILQRWEIVASAHLCVGPTLCVCECVHVSTRKKRPCTLVLISLSAGNEHNVVCE